MAVNLSLRTKGVLAMLVLIGYLALIGVFLAHERKGLVEIVQRMEANQQSIAAFSLSVIES